MGRCVDDPLNLSYGLVPYQHDIFCIAQGCLRGLSLSSLPPLPVPYSPRQQEGHPRPLVSGVCAILYRTYHAGGLTPACVLPACLLLLLGRAGSYAGGTPGHCAIVGVTRAAGVCLCVCVAVFYPSSGACQTTTGVTPIFTPRSLRPLPPP